MSDTDGEIDETRTARFDALYCANIDPWDFRTSGYERDKYAATLAALPRPRYRRALEVGCSIGELSRRLRTRADEVLGLDVSPVAITEARRVHGDRPGLRFEVAELPRQWPDGAFDLVVLSEVLYFMEPEEIDTLVPHVVASLEPNGHVVSVCWTGENDSTLDGDGAATRFIGGFERSGIGDLLFARREPLYRLDVLQRR